MKPKEAFYDLQGNIMDEPLSNLQANYLRLLTQDCSYSQICIFLELNTKDLDVQKMRIMEKFGSRDWSQIISWSYRSGLLNQKKFVDKIVKSEALKFTNTIYENHFVTSPKPFFVPNTIRSLLYDFNNICHKRFLTEAPNLLKLNNIFKKFLQFQFNGFSEDIITKVLNITKEKYEAIEEELKKEFSSNSMFSVLRKALRFSIIKEMRPGSEEQSLNILKSKAAQINLIKTVNQPSNKMRKQRIYLLLVDFYYKNEFTTLLECRPILISKECNSPEIVSLNLAYPLLA
jgi:DNA-binding CsgD family transcriptional regulator